MAVAIGLGIASLAAGVAGTMSSASSAASNAQAQAAQAEINRKWQEWERELNTINMRGDAALAEFNRLYNNSVIERESLEVLMAQKAASRAAEAYEVNQFVRQSRQLNARQQSSLASRGMGRGGTADAIKRQADSDFWNDLIRIEANYDNQRSMYDNQRNQALKQRNMMTTKMPATYIPSVPIPQPDTSGMMSGAIMSSIGQIAGGAAGIYAGMGGMGGASSGTTGQMSTQSMRPGAVSTSPYNGGAAVGIGTGSGFMPLGFGGS